MRPANLMLRLTVQTKRETWAAHLWHAPNMRIVRGMPAGLKVALPIIVLLIIVTALVIRHDYQNPESDLVARQAVQALSVETGRQVKSVTCPRKVDVVDGEKLRCRVFFADGTTYFTTATVSRKLGEGQHFRIDAKFTLPAADAPN